MLFDLPDHDTLYRALLARDTSYDGQAFVGVASTGIFCRLTCPARKPKPENCTFYATQAACLTAGFRACKRCHPLGGDPLVQRLLEALDAEPDLRWSEEVLLARGFEPSGIRKAFKRQFGATFLEIARQRRISRALGALGDQGSVTDAQLEAGFESASAFREAFARLLGAAPSALRGGGLLQAQWIATPLGDMIAVGSAQHLHLLEFVERKALKAELARLSKSVKGDIGIGWTAPARQVAGELEAFFAGRKAVFETPIAYMGTPFMQQVWDALRRIPAGETRSYGQIAAEIGRADAVRAVARANGANPLAIIVPCHRVIGADGSLTGYGGGLWRKQRLIELERHYAMKERVAG